MPNVRIELADRLWVPTHPREKQRYVLLEVGDRVLYTRGPRQFWCSREQFLRWRRGKGAIGIRAAALQGVSAG